MSRPIFSDGQMNLNVFSDLKSDYPKYRYFIPFLNTSDQNNNKNLCYQRDIIRSIVRSEREMINFSFHLHSLDFVS